MPARVGPMTGYARSGDPPLPCGERVGVRGSHPLKDRLLVPLTRPQSGALCGRPLPAGERRGPCQILSPGEAREACSEGCGAPSGRVLFLVGSLSAPRSGDMFKPLPLAYRLFRGQRMSCRQRWTRAFQPGRGADEPLRWSVTPAAKREATLSQMRPQVRFAVLLRRRSPALSCQDGPRPRIPHGAGMGGV